MFKLDKDEKTDAEIKNENQFAKDADKDINPNAGLIQPGGGPVVEPPSGERLVPLVLPAGPNVEHRADIV